MPCCGQQLVRVSMVLAPSPRPLPGLIRSDQTRSGGDRPPQPHDRRYHPHTTHRQQLFRDGMAMRNRARLLQACTHGPYPSIPTKWNRCLVRQGSKKRDATARHNTIAPAVGFVFAKSPNTFQPNHHPTKSTFASSSSCIPRYLHRSSPPWLTAHAAHHLWSMLLLPRIAFAPC